MSRSNVKAAGLSSGLQRVSPILQPYEYGELRKLCNNNQLNDALSAIQKQGTSISRDLMYKILQTCAWKTDLVALRRFDRSRSSLLRDTKTNLIYMEHDHLNTC